MRDIELALKALSQDGALLSRVHAANPWFTPALVRSAIESMNSWWANSGATADEMEAVRQRDIHGTAASVGIIAAGNVPLVGLHDLLCVWRSGHHARIKLSSKDALLIPALLQRVPGHCPIRIVEKLIPSDIDFLLATGSDNTARYLSHDFAQVPRLIRKNRFSVAVLTPTASSEDLDGLARDILLYHGMGCRSVSNLFFPTGMDLSPLWAALDRFPADLLSDAWEEVVQWEQAVAALDGQPPSPTKRLLPQSRTTPSPAKIGVLHLIEYPSETALQTHLSEAKDKIQCIVGHGQPVGFGNSQNPAWDDYADGVNVMELLQGLG